LTILGRISPTAEGFDYFLLVS